ncbi:Zinc finger protein 311 [Frankliniella fusca]|uniref:Zinc finger protein 311 n=1 Tax=Frankliniella fusca TaxID=407009 RepID=A0AAE1LL11_9NEOP|nr:Zinc finger protein 311 [Frankliniella fusca]
MSENSNIPVGESDVTQMTEEMSRYCEAPVVVTSEGVMDSSDASTSNSVIMTTPRTQEVPMVSLSGGKAVYLSDQFTAVLVKPESLLYGVEVPIVKKEPGEMANNEMLTVPTTSAVYSEGVSVPVTQIPWLAPISQPSTQKEVSGSEDAQKAQMVVHETSPDSASATPSAPYMFESKDRLFECEFCPNIRFTRGQLRRHKTVHLGQRNYVCNTCGKRFAWKHSLLKHAVLHTGQAPFSCNQCGKLFSAAHHLQHHVKQHDVQRRYDCSKCDKVFSQAEDLAVHIESHPSTETYMCNICAKCFASKFELTTHMRAHNEAAGTVVSAEAHSLIKSNVAPGGMVYLTQPDLSAAQMIAHPKLVSGAVNQISPHIVTLQAAVPNVPVTSVASCPST